MKLNPVAIIVPLIFIGTWMGMSLFLLIGPTVGSVWRFKPSDPFDKYAGVTNTVLAVSNRYVLFNTSAEGGLTNLSVPVWTWRITQEKIK